MGLHPKLEERLVDEAARFPDLTAVPVDEAREVVRDLAVETDRLAGGAPSVALVRDTSFRAGDHRVRVRVYSPPEAESTPPVVAYFHGGGWVFGDLDTHDSICREIANRALASVVAVDYRRSPEHRFPAAYDDCLAAVRWLAGEPVATRLGFDPTRIALAGDSAGGNLAVGVARALRSPEGPRPAAMVLICPVVDHLPDLPSYSEFATGFGLEGTFLPWMWTQYLRSPEDVADPRVTPARATDLAGLPRTLMQTAECDLLRDEGERFGESLRSSGVEVTVTRYPGMIHGFLDYRGLVEEGWKALEEIGGFLRSALARPPSADPPPPPPAGP